MAKQLAKKFINLFIVLALLTLSLTAPVTAEDNPGEEGVAKQSEAVLALKAFGLLDEEGLDLSSDVTRGSFITVMARIIGASSPANTAFSDVDAGSSLSGAINVATGMGLIAGYGDGTFRPNEPITKMQAAKILVSLLGYDAMALSQGGYPGGYLSVASSLGILRKVEMTGLDKCAWNDAAWLIYNSLDVDLMKNTKYPSETYEVAKGETILSKWLNIRKIEGLIEANDITSLSAPEGVRDGFVKVGGALYFAGKTDAGTFLGHYVKCFYKEDNEGDDTLLLVLPKDTMAIYEFDGSDVENAATGFIEFFNEKTSKIVQLNLGDTAVIYNGKKISRPYTVDDLKPVEGRIKAIDNNKDGVMDVLFVEHSTVYFVDSVSPQTYTITDKYGKEKLVLDPEDPEIKFSIEKNGERIEFSEIAANNVLTVTKSEEGKYLHIRVSDERISGEITEKSEDSIYIDGDEYKIAHSAKSEIEKLKIGDKSLFYFTYDNKVAGTGQVVSKGILYGYLIDGALLKEGLEASSVATFRVFSLSDGVLINFDSAPKMIFNGIRTDNSGNDYNGKSVLEALSAGGRVQHQLIQYELNENQEIKRINMALDNTGSGDGYDEDNFSLDYLFVSQNPTSTGAAYYRTYKTLAGGMIEHRYLTGTAVFLKVPPEDPLTGKIDEKSIKTFSPATLWENDYRIRKVKLYDANKNKEVAVVIEEGIGGDIANLTHFVVDKFTASVDSDGLPVKKIYGYYGKNYIGYNISPESQLADTELSLQKGDVIRVSLNPREEITALIKVFTVKDSSAPGYYLNGEEFDDYDNSTSSSVLVQSTMHRWNQDYKAVHCRAVGRNGSVITVTLGAPGLESFLLSAGSAQVVVYDEKSDTLSLGTIDDISPLDKRQTILVRITYSAASHIYIINRVDEIEPAWVGGYTS